LRLQLPTLPHQLHIYRKVLHLCLRHCPPADERVQLERLRDLLLGPDGQPRAVTSQALRSPLPLDLTAAEQHLLEAYQHKAEAWGWRWVAPAQHQGRGSGFGRPAAPVLTHVPLLWGSTLSTADLKVGAGAVVFAVAVGLALKHWSARHFIACSGLLRAWRLTPAGPLPCSWTYTTCKAHAGQAGCRQAW